MVERTEKLTGFLADKLPKILLLIGTLALAFCAVSFAANPRQVLFSYMTAFIFFLALTLGSLFFILIHFLTRAGWSVILRRIAETLMKNIGLMAILFLPIAFFGMHELYHWTHADAVNDIILQKKAGYLNIRFFFIRAAVFFGIWFWLARVFYKNSVAQDATGDFAHTLKLQKYATFGVFLFALTLTFSVIDWVMSMTPHWYSTMFGVYYFAISTVLSLCVITILAMTLRRAGFLKNEITVEHYHDMGKLVYGFNIFWTYIAFSQYFLIWYANIPEETIWFREHFMGSWNAVAVFLVLGHFVVPFLGFMSRHVKRNLTAHFVVVCWMVFMTIVDLYWVIMPNFSPEGIQISLVDFASFIGIGGLYFGLYFLRLRKHALFPKRDPRLEESLHFHNV